MKKKNVHSSKLVLQKKTISALKASDAAYVQGGADSINVCQLSRRNCEPSWDTGCLSHLSGCALCPTWPTACDM